MYKHILVAINNSAAAKQALAEAIKLAKSHQAQLRIINVIDESILSYGEYGWAGKEKTKEVLDFTQQAAVKVLEEASQFCRDAGVEPETDIPRTETGDITGKILEEAKRWPADLIVMGTHGRDGLHHLFMGSVAMGVVHGSHVPVMLSRAN